MLRIRRYGHAIIFLIALIEAYTNIRYPFHVAVRDYLLAANHDHLAKTGLQVWLLVGVGLIACLLLALFTPSLLRMSMGKRLIALGTASIVTTFCVELISLHSVDAILYHPVGPVALCALFYFLGAALAAGGAFIEHRQRNLWDRQGLDQRPI